MRRSVFLMTALACTLYPAIPLSASQTQAPSAARKSIQQSAADLREMAMKSPTIVPMLERSNVTPEQFEKVSELLVVSSIMGMCSAIYPETMWTDWGRKVGALTEPPITTEFRTWIVSAGEERWRSQKGSAALERMDEASKNKFCADYRNAIADVIAMP